MEKIGEKKTGLEWEKLLPPGRVTSMKELARRLDVSERDAREIVLNARLSGVPICSILEYGGGYVLADKEHLEEAKHTMHAMKRRGLTALKQASVLNKWLIANGGAGYDEQMTIQEFIEEKA